MSEWISVEDRLPEYSETVLLYGSTLDGSPCVYIGCRTSTDCRGENYRLAGLGHNLYDVTHWQSLPEPPQ